MSFDLELRSNQSRLNQIAAISGRLGHIHNFHTVAHLEHLAKKLTWLGKLTRFGEVPLVWLERIHVRFHRFRVSPQNAPNLPSSIQSFNRLPFNTDINCRFYTLRVTNCFIKFHWNSKWVNRLILLLWPGGRLEVCEGLLDPERREPGGRVGVPALPHHPGQGAQMLQHTREIKS